MGYSSAICEVLYVVLFAQEKDVYLLFVANSNLSI